MKAGWSLYLARCADGSLYTGIAKDARERLAKHNAGKGAAYTRARRPLKLVFVKAGLSLSKALRLEIAVKALERRQKLAVVAGRAPLPSLPLRTAGRGRGSPAGRRAAA